MSEIPVLFAVQNAAVWENAPASLHALDALLCQNPPPAGSLMLLPEMFATGFSMRAMDQAAQSHVEIERWMRDTARRYGCGVLGGLAAPVTGGKARSIQNQAVLFSPGGDFQFRYAKQRLFSPANEQNHAKPGREPVLFSWGGVTCSVFLCYDLRFPELFREAVRQGAESLLILANWPERRTTHFTLLTQARAIENQAFALGLNRAGEDPDAAYEGASLAVTPWGVTSWQAGNGVQCGTIPIPIAEVREAREKFPPLRDAGFEF